MDCFLVRYSEKYPSFQYITEPDKLVSHGLLTKSIHWSYEQEVRVIKSAAGLQTFKSQALQEVICGARITKANKLTLEAYLKESHFGHVVLKQASCSKVNYALEFTSTDHSV